MYAPTGRGEKWVMNSEGVVLEYSSEPFHKSDEIIAGINAHFGTSFYQEDDIDKDFTIGETMPNWNAYEKIFITIKYKVQPQGNTNWAIGEMKDNKLYLYVAENPHLGNCGVDDEGKVTMVFLNIQMLFNQIWKPALNRIGISIDTYETKFEYNVGDTIEDWADYIAI